MTIEVVPQPRVDHLVTGLDGMQLRRTDHRGIVWFGGRQEAQAGTLVMRMQTASISTPFWLPDTLAYHSAAADRVLVSIVASVLYVGEKSALADVSARLAVNDNHPAVSHVLVHIRGAARVPLGVSYEVTVLAPLDAIATS